MKKTQLSLALATIFTLAACGGGGGSSSGGDDNGGGSSSGVNTESVSTLPPDTVKNFVKGETFYGKSINPYYANENMVVTFSADGTQWNPEGGEPNQDVPYTEDGNAFSSGDDGVDSGVYVSDGEKYGKFLFNVSGNPKDLIVFSTDQYIYQSPYADQGFTEEEVSGNTLYSLMDDSESGNPAPAMVRYEFKDDYSMIMTMIAGGEGVAEGKWNVANGALAADINFDGDMESIYVYKTKAQDNNLSVIVVQEGGSNIEIISADKEVIQNIYDQWTK